MKQISLILSIMLAVIFVSCSPSVQQPKDETETTVTSTPKPDVSIIPWPKGLPVYDHIVIVIEENKDYDEIIYNPDLPEQPWPQPWPAPYINKLKAEGANFTKCYGEEHFSQGNYYWLFSGDNQTVGFWDEIPSEKTNPNYPFTTPNLASQLIEKGLTFTGYVDSLPEDPMVASSGDYARKHVPWLSFANVPKSVTISFDEFPKDAAGFEKLPVVSFVIPNLEHDMHNSPFPQQIQVGDKWLEENIGPYYEWAKNNNSLLILTFDENDDKRSYFGLTNPLVDPKTCEAPGRDPEYCIDLQNRIVTIFAGAHIKSGDYDEGIGITHVNMLRTIEAMYGLPKAGKQQPNAAGAGISDDYIITDIFAKISTE
jgi:hypothetical protein